jgi:hypothetical protein
MHKKLTITLDEDVYAGLHGTIGPKRISQFIESLLRPHVLDEELDAAYKEMANDEAREEEARQWAEATVGDVADLGSAGDSQSPGVVGRVPRKRRRRNRKAAAGRHR